MVPSFDGVAKLLDRVIVDDIRHIGMWVVESFLRSTICGVVGHGNIGSFG